MFAPVNTNSDEAETTRIVGGKTNHTKMATFEVCMNYQNDLLESELRPFESDNLVQFSMNLSPVQCVLLSSFVGLYNKICS